MPAKHSNYQNLAIALWSHIAHQHDVASLLGIRRETLERWSTGITPFRASVWCLLAQKTGKSLSSARAAVTAPKALAAFITPRTLLAMRRNYIGPLLKSLRRERSLHETAELLELGTWSTYHHWECGRRDLPFFRLLQAIDVLSSRLDVFCETFDFKTSLKKFGLRGHTPGFSENFFALPWTPTVYLILQSHAYLERRRHDSRWLAKQLGLSVEQVNQSLATLGDLGIVTFDGTTYTLRKGQFYAPPTLKPEKLRVLNDYWFSRSAELAQLPGFHKIEEHALSRELAAKIAIWISELRERIRLEVKKSEPETVVHLHWQVADLMTTPLQVHD
jgi:hypothetical protein